MASKKPWETNISGRKYDRNSREPNPSFLIVCEGQTEKLYFKSFQVFNVVRKIVAENASPLEIVNEAIRLNRRPGYDQVWCVFDFDNDPSNAGQAEVFNCAIEKARQNNVNCAYSNDSFELWFLLHYKANSHPHTRQDYYQKLGLQWGDINYEREGKNERFAATIYGKLLAGGNQDQAIARAKQLYEAQKEKPCHDQNPVTTVFQLVELLNAHLRK